MYPYYKPDLVEEIYIKFSKRFQVQQPVSLASNLIDIFMEGKNCCLVIH